MISNPRVAAHAFNQGTAVLQIGHAGSHIVGRSHDLKIVDRLHDLRAGIAGKLP